MTRFFPPLLVGVLLLTIQTTFWASLSIQSFGPDLLLILTLYLGFTYPPLTGGILAFFMGYLTDLFSGNTIGLYTLSRPLLFYGVKHFRNRLYLESLPFKFVFVFLSALMEGLFIVILLAIFTPSPLSHLHLSLLSSLLPQSVSTALVAPIFFFIFDKGMTLFPQRHE
jgi:rod shape-determining protein MreD